jgi:RNA polymerase sigma-70 factor (ECF subfamily)
MKDHGRRSCAAAERVRDALGLGDSSEAARLALEEYGAELFGFLIGTLDDVDRARIVYAEVRRQVESRIAEFSWRCPLRVWLYALARTELRARRRRRPQRAASAPGPRTVVALPPREGDGTGGDASLLRETLPEQDREILILRVDRGLDWRELAWTTLGDRASSDALGAEARSLRARVSEIHDAIEAALRRQPRRTR